MIRILVSRKHFSPHIGISNVRIIFQILGILPFFYFIKNDFFFHENLILEQLCFFTIDVILDHKKFVGFKGKWQEDISVSLGW